VRERERAGSGEESGRVQKIENVERHEGGSRGWGFGASARRVRCTKHVKSLRHPRNRRPPERV